MTDAGHRERKKQKTRDAIVDAALALFDERGYEATTIADIAAAADIAPRTFFGYFPTKEAVVFHDKESSTDGLRERLTHREEGETAMDAMRAWVVDITRDMDFGDERERCRRRLLRASPTLREYERANNLEFEDILATAVARDLGLPPRSLRPRMVAAAATAALNVLADFFDDQAESAAPEPLAVLDEALTFLRGGIAALAAQPPDGA